MDLPEDSGGGLLAEAKAGDNAPALTVTELSMSLKRTIETPSAACACAARFPGSSGTPPATATSA